MEEKSSPESVTTGGTTTTPLPESWRFRRRASVSVFLAVVVIVIIGARFGERHPYPYRAVRFADVTATIGGGPGEMRGAIELFREWFTTPLASSIFRELPVVPLGAETRLAPRPFLDPWPSPEVPLLIPGDRAALSANAGPSTAAHTVRRLAAPADGGPPLLLAGDGNIYSQSGNTAAPWRKNELPGQEIDPWTGKIEIVWELGAHEGRVLSAAFSSDGSRIVTASEDGTARIWNAISGAEIVVLRGGKGGILSAAFSPDGSRIVTASTDGIARIWDAAKGAEIAVLPGHESGLISVAFSLDGSRVVTVSREGTLRIWGATKGDEFAILLSRKGRAPFAALSLDGSRIVADSTEGTASIWDVETDALIANLRGHESAVIFAAFSPDGSRVVTVTGEGGARIWDVAAIAEIAVLPGPKGGVLSAAFSPDGSLIVIVSSEGTARIWNAETGAEIAVLPGPKGGVLSAAFSPDGSRIVTTSDGGFARIWADATRPQIILGVGAGFGGTALTVGAGGYAALKEDSGATWRRLATSAQADLHDAATGTVGQFWAVGDGGLVLHSADNGDSWQIARMRSVDRGGGDLQPPLRGVFVSGAHGVWAVGDEGTVLQSMNGGASWGGLRLDADRLTSVHIQENGIGWISAERDGRAVLFQNLDVKINTPEAWAELDESTYPAPWWFLLGLPGLLFTGFLAVRNWPAPPPAVPAGIAETPVTDAPMTWGDEDRTGIQPLARKVSAFLRNRNTSPPLVFSVTGRWGSGKSSVMHLLKADLERFGLRPVWFNAWHHRKEEHLLAALMENIRGQAIPPWWTATGLDFRIRLILHRLAKSFPGIAVGLGILVVTGVTIYAFWPYPELKLSEGGDLGVIVAALLATPWLYKKLQVLPADAAKLIARLAQKVRIQDLRDKLGLRFRFGRAFREVCLVLRRVQPPGLVIFIDDLDRCQPDDVLEILGAVNYFADAGDCVIVLGMDTGQVESCVGAGFKNIVENLPKEHFLEVYGEAPDDPLEKQRLYARHYLEKLVNIEIRVPELGNNNRRNGNGEAGDDKGDDKEDEPSVPPRWLENLKGILNGASEISRAFLILGLLAMGSAYLAVQHLPTALDNTGKFLAQFVPEDAKTDDTNGPTEQPDVQSPAQETPAGDAEAKPLSENPQGGVIGESTLQSGVSQPPSGPEQSVAKGQPESLAKQVTKEALRADWPGLWWIPATLSAIIVLFLVMRLALARTPRTTEDTPEFKHALTIVHPVIIADNPTPRAIKRYDNRMRYLASLLRPGDYEPDGIDRIIRWFSPKLLPQKWFKEPERLAIPESNLLMIGVVDYVKPAYLEQKWWRPQRPREPSENHENQDLRNAIFEASKAMKKRFPDKWNAGELDENIERFRGIAETGAPVVSKAGNS